MDGVKTMLRGILTATPTAMTIEKLSKEYRNTVGEYIPYQKLGYNSLEHLLRSIPDTIMVQGSGPLAFVNLVVSAKSSHVLELVSRQKIVAPKKRYSYGPPTRRRQIVGPPQTGFFKTYKPPDSRSESQKIIYPHAHNNKPADSRSESQKIFYPANNKPQFAVTNNSTTRDIPISKPPLEKTAVQASDVNKINSGKCEYEQLTVTTPVKNLNDKPFFEQVNAKLEQLHSYSSPSAQSLRKSHSSSDSSSKVLVSDVRQFKYPIKINVRANFSNTKQENTAPILNRNTDININDIIPNDISEREKGVPETVRNNLKKLIGHFPDGLWCSELPGEYRKMFKRELKFQDLGFPNLINLCISLESIFHFIRPSNEDYKLFDRSKPLPSSIDKNFTAASFSIKNDKEVPSALPKLEWSDIDKFLPPDVFKPGNEIPRTFVNENTQENDTIEIIVAEVFDVSKFWVYRNDGELDQLMDDLQMFYSVHADDYKLPPNMMREGIYCVTLYYAEYHRALIVDPVSHEDGKIRVFFIDYGTVDRIKPDLYFLHEQFAQLPSQTIRCRLANICPPKEKAPWSLECSKVFRQFLPNRHLVAKISRVDWKNKIIDIFLADVTDQDNVFYINDVLVDKGLAAYPDQQDPNLIIDSVSTPIVNRIHLFPTFLELEHGLAPSTKEMAIFHEFHTPINFCYPQYFKIDYSKEEEIIKKIIEYYETHVRRRLRQKISPHHTNFDFSKLQNKPLDRSTFAGLAEEVAEFWGDDDDVTSFEELPEEEEESDITAKNRQIELWTQTISELKDDCILTENIIDILNICDSNLSGENPNACEDFLDSNLSIEEMCLAYSRSRDDILQEDLSSGPSQNRSVNSSSPRINEGDDRESIFSDEDNLNRNHPLAELTFSRSVSSESTDDEENERDPDFFNKFDEISNQFRKNPDSFNKFDEISNEDSKDVEIVYEEVAESHTGETSNLKTNFTSTNPFLQDILYSEEPKTDIVTNCGQLHPTNPFLSYIPKPKDDNSDENSDSTASTDYATIIQEVKFEQTWSEIDHVASDMSISQYSETLDSAPALNSDQYSGVITAAPDQNRICSNSMPLENTTSSQPVTNAVKEVQSVKTAVAQSIQSTQSAPGRVSSGFDVTSPEFYPQSHFYPPNPYGFPPYYAPSYNAPYYSHPAALNPYYNYNNFMQQQINRQVMMRSTLNVTQTAQIPPPPSSHPPRPPPGFEPNSNVFTTQGSAGNQLNQDFYAIYNKWLKDKYSP